MSDTIHLKLSAFRDQTRYYRTGLVLVPKVDDEAIDRIARALPGDLICWAKHVVASLRPEQKHTQQSPQVVLGRLQGLTVENALFVGRVVEGLDIALAHWDRPSIEAFWDDFAVLKKNPSRALVCVMPALAVQLLPHPKLANSLCADGRYVQLDQTTN